MITIYIIFELLGFFQIVHVQGTENVAIGDQDVKDLDPVNVTTGNVVEIEIEKENVNVTGTGSVIKTGNN